MRCKTGKKREKWRNSMVISFVDWFEFSLKCRTLPKCIESIAFIVRIHVQLSHQQNYTNHSPPFAVESLTLRSFPSLRLVRYCVVRSLSIHSACMCVYVCARSRSLSHHTIWKHTQTRGICFAFVREQEGQLRIVRRTLQTCCRVAVEHLFLKEI